MDVPAPLAKRVGPFTVAGWLAIGLAGIGIGLLVRRSGLFNNKTPEPLESVDEDGNPIQPVGPGYAWPTGGVVATSNAPAGPSSSTSTTEPTLEDNLGWSKRAIAWLIAQGVDPADADAGIRKYLQGDALTAAQLRAVKRALSESTIGPPPEYVPAINQTPEAPPEAPPPPPTPTPTPVAPPAPSGPSSVTGTGALVQDGSGAVFFTNGNAIEWVSNGNVSIAKWRAGASVAGFAGALDPNAPSAYPVPHNWTRAQVQSIPYKVGPAPPEWGGSWT